MHTFWLRDVLSDLYKDYSNSSKVVGILTESFTSMRLLSLNIGCDIKHKADSSAVTEQHGYG